VDDVVDVERAVLAEDEEVAADRIERDDRLHRANADRGLLQRRHLGIGIELVEVAGVIAAAEDDDFVDGAVFGEIMVDAHGQVLSEHGPLLVLLGEEEDVALAAAAVGDDQAVELGEAGDAEAAGQVLLGVDLGQGGPLAGGDVVAADDRATERAVVENATARVDGVVVVAVAGAVADPIGLRHDLPGVAVGPVGDEAGTVGVVAAAL